MKQLIPGFSVVSHISYVEMTIKMQSVGPINTATPLQQAQQMRVLCLLFNFSLISLFI